MKKWLLAAIIGVVGVGLIWATMMVPSKMDAMKTANLAPTIVLQDLQGNAFDLSKMKGEKVYVKFWASWCPICLAGLDELNTLSGEDNKFKVVTVVSPGFGGEQSKEDFAKWFKTLGYKNIVVLLDEQGKVAQSYGVRAYPTSVFIDSKGSLAKKAPGHQDNNSVKKQFEGIQ